MQLKNILLRIKAFTFFIILLSGFSATKAATLTGTYTIPGTVEGTPVNNLAGVSAVLSANTVSGTVIFEFTASYAGESSFPVIFTAFTGSGNVIIRPAASVSTQLLTSGSPTANALIYFLSADYITIDGRPGGTGTARKWTFQNSMSSSSYPTFSFTDGATNNVLKYLIVKSSATSSTGTILFNTSSVAGGNSFNTISNDSICNYATNPYNPILSKGSPANPNANNTISDNNICNFISFFSGGPFAAINITSTGNGSNWTITGNSVYSVVPALAQGSTPIFGIYFNPGINYYLK